MLALNEPTFVLELGKLLDLIVREGNGGATFTLKGTGTRSSPLRFRPSTRAAAEVRLGALSDSLNSGHGLR
jgi:hypothetical protein